MTTYAIVASDRDGYGHEPRRYDITATTETAAAEEGRHRYGKHTGLDSADIDIENAGPVPGADRYADANLYPRD